MAKLDGIIRLHRHAVDEKRRVLADMFQILDHKTLQLAAIDAEFENECTLANADPAMAADFAAYIPRYQDMRKIMEKEIAIVERRIEEAKDDLLESFSELKKFEMTEAERQRLAREERKIKDARTLDDIALTIYNRNSNDGNT